MSRTPLALIRGVKKLCKDLGVDPEDVRTFRFFTPPPHLPTLSCPCLFVCLFFPVLLMYGFLFHFCKTTLAMCMALQYKERSYYYYYYQYYCLYLKLMSSNNFLYISSSLTLQQNKVRHSCHFHGC